MIQYLTNKMVIYTVLVLKLKVKPTKKDYGKEFIIVIYLLCRQTIVGLQKHKNMWEAILQNFRLAFEH